MPPKKPKLTQTKISFGKSVAAPVAEPIEIDPDRETESTDAARIIITTSLIIGNEVEPTDVEQPQQGTTQTQPTTAAKKESSVRTFQVKWKALHPWLSYDEQNKSMFCTVCIKAGCKNVFTTGCNV